MKDYTGARFYAITGIGYGKGFTAEEAVENYIATQCRNFKASREEVLAESWGRIWQAPEGTIGFVLDSSVQWEVGGEYVAATPDQRVGDVGNVPDWAKDS